MPIVDVIGLAAKNRITIVIRDVPESPLVIIIVAPALIDVQRSCGVTPFLDRELFVPPGRTIRLHEQDVVIGGGSRHSTKDSFERVRVLQIAKAFFQRLPQVSIGFHMLSCLFFPPL